MLRSKMLVLIAVLTLPACKHPLQIWGEGDILSATGSRDCLLEDFQLAAPACAENLVQGDYAETYTAVPRPGYQFRRWGNGYCRKSLTNECSFEFNADVVALFDGITVPALQAVFRPLVNTGFTALVAGNEFTQTFAAGLEAHAVAAGFPDHATTTFFAAGDAGAPQALWEDPVARAGIQAVLDTGTVELFGLSYSPAFPAVAGYLDWVNYALARNPDTRFFIATPWPSNPGDLDAAGFAAQVAALEGAVHGLVDALRSKHAGVDFYAVPTGRAAMAMVDLHAQSALPDVSSLIGAAETAVFVEGGAPGNILTELGRLLWLGGIYAVDLSGYSYAPGYTTDLKSLGAQILADHPAAYQAPPEVDTDTDGDGIVDRLDPNPAGQLNLLVMMVDDFGFNDLAINNGNAAIDTPNLDQFAQSGMRFTRHYTATVCAPARAALLTGMVPERVGFSPSARGISGEFVTLAEHLGTQGFTTWHIGKWHLGDLERLAWPDHQGFDHWFGFLTSGYLAGAMAQGQLAFHYARYNNPWLMGDTEPGAHYPGHLENILTERAIAELTGLVADGERWYMNLWFFAPHGPVQPAAEFAALYPDSNAGRYQALVAQLDFNIGRILDHLEALGVGHETVVVVVSDNGGVASAVDSNFPFFGTKGWLREGGVRTPLIIRWPDETLNGQVYPETITITDLYPTLLSGLGIAAPADLDGHDFYPVLKQEQAAPQRDLHWEHGPVSYGVLSADGRYRFHQLPDYYGAPVGPVAHDLLADPTGTATLSPIPPAVDAALQASHGDWFREVHTVATQYTPDAFGGGELTGMDFLRTPGFGKYTLGLGIPDGYSGPLAAQGSIWSMAVSGDIVTAQFGPVQLSGEITAASSCHSVVVTGQFQRKLLYIQPGSISLSLYIDGIEVDSAMVEGQVELGDASLSTQVGDPGATAHNGTILPPRILNAMLDDRSPWTVQDFSAELCAQT